MRRRTLSLPTVPGSFGAAMYAEGRVPVSERSQATIDVTSSGVSETTRCSFTPRFAEAT